MICPPAAGFTAAWKGEVRRLIGTKMNSVSFRFRRYRNRVLGFLRPKPFAVPLTVAEILRDASSRSVVDAFGKLYYESEVARQMQWRGVPLLKNPCDAWTVIDIIQQLQPSVIIETGTAAGGSSILFADIARLCNIDCRVITIDVNPKWARKPSDYGVTSITGYSTDSAVFNEVCGLASAQLAKNPGHVLVILDSAHDTDNVLRELNLYAPLVTKDSYLIVEDTNVNGHPSFSSHGPGPWEAVDAFLELNSAFEPDREREKYLLTFNPRGFLRRRE